MCNLGHSANSIGLVWVFPAEKMMDGTYFSRTESIGERSVSVLSSNNLKSQFLISIFLQRAMTTFSFIIVIIINAEIREKQNTSWNAKEIVEINDIAEMNGLGFSWISINAELK